MNRSIKLLAILSVLLIVLLSFSLVACNKGNGNDTNTDTATNTDTNTDTSTDTSTDTNTDVVPEPEKPEIYTVTFRQGNGVPDVVLTIERGTSPTLPEIQPEVGYILEWEVTDFTNLCNDGLVGVHRTPIPFDVTYVVGEGVNNKENPNKITIVDTIKLKAPTRVGCEFNGWYSDEACTNKIEEISKGTKENITVYAGWTPINYSISFDAAGGTNNAQNPSSYNVDSEFTLLSPTRADFDFVGWYVKGTDDKVETTEDIFGNVELEARWIVERFEITYVGVESSEHNNPADFDKTESFTFEPATRNGYTFHGWYADENYTTPITGITANTKENKTVYAKITIDEYTIEYVLGAGMTNDASNIKKYNVNTEFELIAPSYKDGYTFSGWYIKDTDTKVEIIVQGGPLQQNLVLEAKFDYTKYMIDYNTDGGNMPEGAQDYYTVENTGSNAFVLPTPVKQGYTFAGWYTDSNFSSLKVTTLDGNNRENVTLYAQWRVAKYVITYDYGISSVGVNNPNKTIYTMDSHVEFEKASKDGYIFIGWYSDAEFSNPIKSTEGLYENITVYAQWLKGSNIAGSATLTTDSGFWALKPSDIAKIVDGNKETGVYGDSNPISHTYTFDFSSSHFVKNVVLTVNGKGQISQGPQVNEITQENASYTLTAYDANGNVVYEPVELESNGAETVEFEIGKDVSKIEITVHDGWNTNAFLWEVEIFAAS